MSSKEEQLQVYVRVRPPILREVKHETAVMIGGDRMISIATENKEISCKYDHVFNEVTEQEDIFERVKPLLVDVLSGINSCVFAYGQTSSGKSYTMIGPNGGQDIPHMNPQHRGIIPRASEFLMGYLNDKAEDNSLTYTAKASFLQIYNETIYDLLKDSVSMFDDKGNTRPDADLKIREVSKPKSVAALSDHGLEVYVSGLSEFRVQTSDDILRILAVGTNNRMTRSTDFNATSSRSHAILQLSFEIETQVESGQTLISRSKLNLIDLAGSEKMMPYNGTEAIGEARHVKELASINKSLSSLGNVITALSSQHKRSHIPYRDSKLTRLLQDSLGGNTRTILIACVAPTVLHSAETISTLQFAERAKNVKLTVKSNTVIDDKLTLAKAQAEITRLKSLLSHALKQIESRGTAGAGDGSSSEEKNASRFETLALENEKLRKENEELRRSRRKTQTTPLSSRPAQSSAQSSAQSPASMSPEVQLNRIRLNTKSLDDLRIPPSNQDRESQHHHHHHHHHHRADPAAGDGKTRGKDESLSPLAARLLLSGKKKAKNKHQPQSNTPKSSRIESEEGSDSDRDSHQRPDWDPSGVTPLLRKSTEFPPKQTVKSEQLPWNTIKYHNSLFK